MTSQPLLAVDNLSVSFRTPQGENAAVCGVSFTLSAGETLALVGESGSGKSVTALSLLQLLNYPTAFHPSGSIRFAGRELVGASEAELRDVRGDDMAMIFQEPMTSLNPLHTIEAQIAESLALHKGLAREAAKPRVVELLQKVGFADAESRLKAYPHELSGGQRQRVMIAMALANDPKILIADEPTTALDVTIQAQILKLLKELQAQHKMALLLITHDLGIVRKTADRVAVMQKGVIVEAGRTEDVFAAPQHAYTKQLLAAEPKGDPIVQDNGAETIVSATDLRVWFPVKSGWLRRVTGHVKAVDGVSFAVKAGHTLGVVGESGSGKTTLGQAVLRLVSSRGDIVFSGQDIQGRTWKAMRPLRRQMQIVFQDPYGSLSPRLTMGEIVAEGLDIHRLAKSPQERERLVDEALREVGLDPAMKERYPHEFSGVQRQRISIARALLIDPRILILDEATSSVDSTTEKEIQLALDNLVSGRTTIAIAHRLSTLRRANRLVVLDRGAVVEVGQHDELMAQQGHYYALYQAQARHAEMLAAEIGERDD